MWSTLSTYELKSAHIAVNKLLRLFRTQGNILYLGLSTILGLILVRLRCVMKCFKPVIDNYEIVLSYSSLSNETKL